jgi:hypothetical protein
MLFRRSLSVAIRGGKQRDPHFAHTRPTEGITLPRHLPQFRSAKFTVIAAGAALCVATGASATAATWPFASATPWLAAVQEAAAGHAATVGHATVGHAVADRVVGSFDPQAAEMLAFQSVRYGFGARVIVIEKAAAQASAARARALKAREHAAHLAVEARLRAAARAAARQHAAQQAPQQPTATSSPTTPASGSPQQIAEAMLGQFGWSDGQFSCLDSLWTQESGWNVYAENPSSGAYGIPQALPGGKMASAGPDWQTDATTQITWGLGYIQSTYGSPCAAWAHEEADGWY